MNILHDSLRSILPQILLREQICEAVLETVKRKYETEKETLADLVKLRNEMQKEELMEAVLKSEHSYAEILAFIKGGKKQEEYSFGKAKPCGTVCIREYDIESQKGWKLRKYQLAPFSLDNSTAKAYNSIN